MDQKLSMEEPKLESLEENKHFTRVDANDATWPFNTGLVHPDHHCTLLGQNEEPSPEGQTETLLFIG